MKEKYRSLARVRIIYMFTSVFLAVLSVYAFMQIRKLSDSTDVVNRTHDVTLTLQKISISITEAETYQRGFLLAGDSLFIHRKELALDTLHSQLATLDHFVQGNAVQIANLKKLHTSVAMNIDIMEKVVGQYSRLYASQAFKDYTIEGLRRMDTLKMNVNTMTANEQELLKARVQDYSKLSGTTPFFAIVLFLGALLILLMSYLKINKELKYSNVLHGDLKRGGEDLKTSHEQLVQNNTDLANLNVELESFTYISSHDLQEPLRKIQTFASRIIDEEFEKISPKGQDYFMRIQSSAKRMQSLIDDLLAYSRTNVAERKFETVNLSIIIEEVKDDLSEELRAKNAVVTATNMYDVKIIPFQFRQLLQNLIGNSLKFSVPGKAPQIVISSEILMGDPSFHPKLQAGIRYCHITIADNGIGFEAEYNLKVFEVFQRIHEKTVYAGTGIGLAIVKKIVENHNGFITASGEPEKGVQFDIYIPAV